MTFLNLFTGCLLFIVTLLSCQSNSSINEKINNDEVIEFNPDDNEMNKAISKAIETLPDFEKVFQEKNEKHRDFAFKVRFDTPDGGGEHIWVGDIKIENNQYSGIVLNDPRQTSQVKYGDDVTIDLSRISDWQYIDNGVLKGGYTIRVMRNSLSESEKKAFDESIDFVIED